MTAMTATSATSATTDSRWTDALTAAALLAVDPAGLGGALLRARCGPQRAHWLAQLHALLPAGTPQRRVPLHIADERLLGKLDEGRRRILRVTAMSLSEAGALVLR